MTMAICSLAPSSKTRALYCLFFLLAYPKVILKIHIKKSTMPLIPRRVKTESYKCLSGVVELCNLAVHQSPETARMKHYLILICLILFPLAVKSQPVYKTPSGEKYHLATCRTVKNVSEELSVDDATKKNLQPCKICKPPQSNGASSLSSNRKGKGEANTVQCKGTTKKGNRCQHRTRIANGYCFQHNPDK